MSKTTIIISAIVGSEQYKKIKNNEEFHEILVEFIETLININTDLPSEEIVINEMLSTILFLLKIKSLRRKGKKIIDKNEFKSFNSFLYNLMYGNKFFGRIEEKCMKSKNLLQIFISKEKKDFYQFWEINKKFQNKFNEIEKLARGIWNIKLSVKIIPIDGSTFLDIRGE